MQENAVSNMPTKYDFPIRMHSYLSTDVSGCPKARAYIGLCRRMFKVTHIARYHLLNNACIKRVHKIRTRCGKFTAYMQTRFPFFTPVLVRLPFSQGLYWYYYLEFTTVARESCYLVYLKWYLMTGGEIVVCSRINPLYLRCYEAFEASHAFIFNDQPRLSCRLDNGWNKYTYLQEWNEYILNTSSEHYSFY